MLELVRDCLAMCRLDVDSYHNDQEILTTAVCSDTGFPHRFDAFLFDQSAQSMESSSCFEGANLLLILAFDEEADFWISIRSGSVALDAIGMRCWLRGVRPCSRTTSRLGRGCENVQRLACYSWRTVNVPFNAFVGVLHRETVNRWTGAEVCHCERWMMSALWLMGTVAYYMKR